MAHLWKLSSKPLYPVCQRELIFFVEGGSQHEAELVIAELESCGLFLGDAGEEKTLNYLGEFEPAYENQFHNNVITYQNGDY